MRAAGFTLIEFLLAVAIASILGLASAKLLQAGLRTYVYTARQEAALSSGTAALRGEGTRQGLVMTARGGKSVASLASDSLAVVSSSGVLTTFSVSNGVLLRGTSPGTTVQQTAGVDSLGVDYYYVDAGGQVAVAPTAAGATMATFRLGVKRLSGATTSYVLFSGVQLRNHP